MAYGIHYLEESRYNDCHHCKEESVPHSKWMYPPRSVYPTPQTLPEYDHPSPISGYGTPPASDKHYYMLSPSPEPPTIACAMSSASIAFRLALPRDGDYDGRPGGLNSSYGSPTSSDSSSSTGPLEVTISVVSSADKPFVCAYPGCRIPFGRQEHLKRHEKRHTGERPFRCGIQKCGKYFARNDNLKQHLKTHTKRGGRNCYVEGLRL